MTQTRSRQAAPALADGLTDIERRLLAVLRAGRGRQRSGRLLERALDARVPSLEVALTEGQVSPEVEQPLAAYWILVRWSQPWSTLEPLIELTGNGGGAHGEPPADAVYTQIALTDFGRAVAEGWVYLPLFAGSSLRLGVHEAGALPRTTTAATAAVIRALASPDCADDVLLELLGPPDFPTGGEIVSTAHEARVIDVKGAGKLRVRGALEATTIDGKPSLVVTAGPPTVSLATIVDALAASVTTQHPEVVDVQDHTSRDGVRIVLALAPGSDTSALSRRIVEHYPLTVELAVDVRAVDDDVERRVKAVDLARAAAAHSRAAAAGDATIAIERLETIAAAFPGPRRTRGPAAG